MEQYTIAEIKKAVAGTLKRNDVKRAAVFGSFSRGEATSRSDVDLLVEFSGSKSLLDLVRLKLALQKRLSRKVDLLTYASLNPRLKKRILAEKKDIYDT